jgi:hypothetical protein
MDEDTTDLDEERREWLAAVELLQNMELPDDVFLFISCHMLNINEFGVIERDFATQVKALSGELETLRKVERKEMHLYEKETKEAEESGGVAKELAEGSFFKGGERIRFAAGAGRAAAAQCATLARAQALAKHTLALRNHFGGAAGGFTAIGASGEAFRACSKGGNAHTQGGEKRAAEALENAQKAQVKIKGIVRQLGVIIAQSQVATVGVISALQGVLKDAMATLIHAGLDMSLVDSKAQMAPFEWASDGTALHRVMAETEARPAAPMPRHPSPEPGRSAVRVWHLDGLHRAATARKPGDPDPDFKHLYIWASALDERSPFSPTLRVRFDDNEAVEAVHCSRLVTPREFQLYGRQVQGLYSSAQFGVDLKATAAQVFDLGLSERRKKLAELNHRHLFYAPPMQVLPFTALKNHGSIPRSSDYLTTSMSGLGDSAFVVYYSHTWMRRLGMQNVEVPHPDNKAHAKWAALLAALEKLAEEHEVKLGKVYVWVDYACCFQDDPVAVRAAQHCLPLYMARCNAFLFDRRDAYNGTMHSSLYETRAWCRLEQFLWLSLHRKPWVCDAKAGARYVLDRLAEKAAVGAGPAGAEGEAAGGSRPPTADAEGKKRSRLKRMTPDESLAAAGVAMVKQEFDKRDPFTGGDPGEGIASQPNDLDCIVMAYMVLSDRY